MWRIIRRSFRCCSWQSDSGWSDFWMIIWRWWWSVPTGCIRDRRWCCRWRSRRYLRSILWRSRRFRWCSWSHSPAGAIWISGGWLCHSCLWQSSERSTEPILQTDWMGSHPAWRYWWRPSLPWWRSDPKAGSNRSPARWWGLWWDSFYLMCTRPAYLWGTPVLWRWAALWQGRLIWCRCLYSSSSWAWSMW